MKENGTATCPICGVELQVQGKALFKEHHKRLWEKKVADLGIEPYDEYEECFGKLFYQPIVRTSGYFGCTHPGAPLDKPAELIRWEAENPVPEMDMLDFVISFAKKFLKIEKGNTV